MKTVSRLAAAIAVSACAGLAQATTIDLVTGDSGTANGTLFNWVDAQSTGTGVIDPFLRIQNDGTESGYNTDNAGESDPLDDKGSPHTHDLRMSDLTSVYIGGTQYYEFLLDINENGNANGRYLSMNAVQIFTRSTQYAGTADEAWSDGSLGAKRYDMDAGADGDVTVEFDYKRNNGSGSGDMLMYVLADLFADASADDYVYFYSAFGSPHSSDAGFEEWSLRECTASETLSCSPPNEVPVPGTIGLLGIGLAGLGLVRRRKAA